MKMLLDVEDDQAWQSAEAKDKDAGETTNHNVGHECLDRLAIAFGGKTIVFVSLEQLLAYLSARGWQSHHAADLIALAQIAEGFLKGLSNIKPFCAFGPDDVATICYSSGTTRTPKDNMKLLEDMAVLKTTTFSSVPRLYNRIYAGLINAAKAYGGLKMSRLCLPSTIAVEASQLAQLKLINSSRRGEINPLSSQPRRSFYHVKEKLTIDDRSLPNSPSFPTYIAATESTKAKSRSLSSQHPEATAEIMRDVFRRNVAVQSQAFFLKLAYRW